MGNVLKYSDLREYCDTCDSKNDKTPVDARTRTCERGRLQVFLQFIFSLFSSFLKVGKVSTHYLKKNKPKFSVKQYVVFNKTTRRFVKNKPKFYEKQAVD